MIVALHNVLRRLLSRHLRGGRLYLLFDYDGTLAPIAETPAAASLPRNTRAALERLMQAPRVHLGVISGRQIADLRRMVAIPDLFLAGTSGLELDFAGVEVRHPAAGSVGPQLQRLVARILRTIDRYPAAWIEIKPLGATVHYRRVPDTEVALLRAAVGDALAPEANGFRLMDGARSLEIVANLGWTKGTAVRMMLDSLAADDAQVLYAGDGSNDSDAMDTVAAAGGITIGIGAEAPRSAQYRIAHPGELAELLSALAEWLVRSQVLLSRGP